MSDSSASTLQPGDMVYYEPHDALGLLITRYSFTSEDGETKFKWRYSLRSPLKDNADIISVSIQTVFEEMLLTGVCSGRLQLFKVHT